MMWSFAIIIFSIGIYYGIISMGALGNIDTTGQPSSGTKIGTLIFCVIIAAVGIALVNRKRS